MPFGLPYPSDSQANKWLSYNYSELTTFAGKEYVPDLPSKPYGCGAWGCVYPTKNKDVVLKLTLDYHEALYASATHYFGESPEGISKHYAVAQTSSRLYKKPVFAIWRESVYLPGKAYEWYPGVDRSIVARFIKTLHACSHFSLVAHASCERGVTALSKSVPPMPTSTKDIETMDAAAETSSGARFFCEGMRGGRRLAFALSAFRRYAEIGAKEGFASTIFEALIWYLERGVVLADVHSGNVGIARRGDADVPVIFDPGHACIIDGGPRWNWPGSLSQTK